MEHVSAGNQASTPQQRWLANLRDTKPTEFLREFRTLEREYQQRLAKQAPPPSLEPDPRLSASKVEPEVDEGTERVEELITRLLREAKGS